MRKRFTAGFLTSIIAFGFLLGYLGSAEKKGQGLPGKIKTATGITIVLIPGGTFQMGDPKGKNDARPVHTVKVDSFYMDATEVTQKSFQALTGLNPSRFRDKKGPVERVRWTDAAIYCNARSRKEGLKPCYDPKTWKCDFSANGYRLPTEAEWEFAARGNTTTDRFFDKQGGNINQYAWHRKNSRDKVHPVGRKKPNPFGLYDIYGNVMEWCNDFYDPEYYGRSPKENPRGPETGKKRVLRGGAWATRPKYCRSGRRYADDPNTADICQGYDTYGFRCVRRAAPIVAKPQK